MKKLNNKGYMLVEIIIASVLALIVAWFLIDITVKMVNKNNDYYIESVLLTDKNVITKEIMDDINDSELNLISVTHNRIDDNNHVITLEFKDKNNDKVTRKIKISNTVIQYIYGDNEENEENDIKYERTLNENLKIGDIEVINDPGLLRIDIPAYMNFSDENYGINLMVKYNGELEKANLPEYYKYEQTVNLEGTTTTLSKDFDLENNITKIKSCEIVYSDDYSEEEKKAIVNCEAKDGKKANVMINVNSEKASDKVEKSSDKESDKIAATTSQGSCSNWSCNYGDSRSGSICSSTRVINGQFTALYRCHEGNWVNVGEENASYQPCNSDERETSFSCSNVGITGTCSPNGTTDSKVVPCTRKCTKTYSATCTSYYTDYSCPATYTRDGANCYKCDDSGFTFNPTTLKCDGTCLVDNYKYKVNIKYK